MNTSKPGKSVVWGLVLWFTILLGVSGCASVPFGMNLESMFAPAAPTGAPEAKPMTTEPKPADADEHLDLRHPHRWRKKLRAKYA